MQVLGIDGGLGSRIHVLTIAQTSRRVKGLVDPPAH
jgi:hypothetical protein